MKTLLLSALLLVGEAWGQGNTHPIGYPPINPDSIWNGHCGYGLCVHPIHIQGTTKQGHPYNYGPYRFYQQPELTEVLSLPRLVALWDEYKDSCFADSTGAASPGTVRVFGTPCWVESEWPGEITWDEMRKNCKRPDHSHYTAVHRTPDFPGFMDFIERRTK